MAKFNASEVAQALVDAQGMVTTAARRLGCTRKTIYNYINNYPTVAEALQDARANLGDRIETTLLHEALGVRDKATGEYTRDPNITALIFLAKTHPAMRERGYAEKQQIEHSGQVGWAQFLAEAQGDDSDTDSE